MGRTRFLNRGKNKLEFIVFGNYEGGLDVYQRDSLWEPDKLPLFRIDNMSTQPEPDNKTDPNLWRTATTMRYVKHLSWPTTDMPEAMPVDLFSAQRSRGCDHFNAIFKLMFVFFFIFTLHENQ